ncbi:MAG: AIR synthase family protein [Thermoproteus sp.]|nr:AIR synthase family protein [Thermoproteus sp.]
MKVGKLSLDIMAKYIFSRSGAYDPAVLVGPAAGEDAAVVRIRGRHLVAHVDPISGSVELLGWLAVNVASNDVAVRGVRPRWAMPTVLLPPSADEAVLDKITSQMDSAARELGVAIVGGHTEVTTAVTRPVVVMAVAGEGDRYITTGGARPGDIVLMTKSAALEAAAILATDFGDEMRRKGIPEDVLKAAAGFIKQISVVREALAISDLATSMHDPTEGGIAAGLAEMAHASGASIEADPSRIPVSREAEALCKAAGLDPLRTLSSGSLLATVPEEKVEEALDRLRKLGVSAVAIGRVIARASFLVKIGDIEITNPYIRDKFFELFQ